MGTKDQGAETDAPAPVAEEVVPPTAEVPAEITPEPAAAPETPDPVSTAIQSWLYEHIANSPISQNTEIWNFLNSKLGALRDAIIQGT